MDANGFIAAVNRKAPPHLRRADREFLKRCEIILGPAPYYMDSIPKAIALLGVQYEFRGEAGLKEAPRPVRPEPPAAISQVIVIHNSDGKQCHRIRRGLFQTGFINFEGYVFVNFSPYTQRTIQSLPADAFAETEYHMEYSVFEQDLGDGTTKPLGWALNPVFFMKAVEPTLVQLFFLAGGRRQPALRSGKPLPVPLYQAFLNVDSGSAEEIMRFMNAFQVYLFPMSWDPQGLLDYVSGSKRTMRLGLVGTKKRLKRLWSAEQRGIRGVLAAAEQGRLGEMMFPPVFPLCENSAVEWRLISGYFEPQFDPRTAQVPEGVRLALFEFKEAGTSGEVVPVRRYYGWDSYMWAELADDIHRGKAALVCERCGTIIARGKHGSPKRFCSREENPRCCRERNSEKVSASRKGRPV